MYQYPDNQDKITGIMIKEIELYPSYWYKSDDSISNVLIKCSVLNDFLQYKHI